jgi:hypothetical protein
MRLLLAVALVLSMSGTETERALALARARDADRQQFHRRYLIDLAGPVVSQVEVVTEFRRLVIIAEEHVLRGDWMFTRSPRAAGEALAPTRGLITLKAQVRFNPLNTFIESPPYTLTMGATSAGSPLAALDTALMPEYSVAFKARDGRNLSSLLGARLEANIAADRIGQTARSIGVALDGKEVARTTVDFGRLD